MVLLRKNNCSRNMLYIAKETIEDERNNIKSSDISNSYTREDRIEDFTVKTLVKPTDKYKCFNLNVKVSNSNKEIELNTYVTKKK